MGNFIFMFFGWAFQMMFWLSQQALSCFVRYPFYVCAGLLMMVLPLPGSTAGTALAFVIGFGIAVAVNAVLQEQPFIYRQIVFPGTGLATGIVLGLGVWALIPIILCFMQAYRSLGG